MDAGGVGLTTIAWNGRYLAADRLHCTGGMPHYEATKLLRVDSYVYASAGPSAWFQAWIDWARTGADPYGQLPVTGLEGHQGSFIRLDLDKRICEMMDFRLPYFAPAGPFWGWGSGADYALGAMQVGATPMEAVQAAGCWDSGTGGAVDLFDLEFIERDVQRWDGAMPSKQYPMPVKSTDPLSQVIMCAKFDDGTRHDPRCDCPDAPHNR